MLFGATLTQVSAGIGTMLSTGFVTWALRGGALASALLSSMPAWRGFDPLVMIIARRRKEEKNKEEDKEISKIDRLFENAPRDQDPSQKIS